MVLIIKLDPSHFEPDPTKSRKEQEHGWVLQTTDIKPQVPHPNCQSWCRANTRTPGHPPRSLSSKLSLLKTLCYAMLLSSSIISSYSVSPSSLLFLYHMLCMSFPLSSMCSLFFLLLSMTQNPKCSIKATKKHEKKFLVFGCSFLAPILTLSVKSTL